MNLLDDVISFKEPSPLKAETIANKKIELLYPKTYTQHIISIIHCGLAICLISIGVHILSTIIIQLHLLYLNPYGNEFLNTIIYGISSNGIYFELIQGVKITPFDNVPIILIAVVFFGYLGAQLLCMVYRIMNMGFKLLSPLSPLKCLISALIILSTFIFV